MFRAAPDSAKKSRMEKFRSWCARHPYWTLATVTFALLLPFCAKPFNLDDPLFIWVAKQIQVHPADPFGFTVNWGLTAVPMYKATDNPPLACYYVALAGSVLGWSEFALHLAFIFPAIGVVLGTHRLARHFCNSPMIAAFATLFMPVFMVSSMTIMCDVLMLAFWVWAMVFWIEGLERENFRKLFGAGVLISLAAVTKYFGFCLVPLLGVYGITTKRRGAWAAALLVPLATFAAYQWATAIYYGAPLLQAASYSLAFKAQTRGGSLLPALAFTGGCAAVAFFVAPLLWRKRMLMMFAATVVVIIPILFLDNGLWNSIEGTPVWGAQLQLVFWAVCGVSVLTLVGTDLYHRRDNPAWLLALWVLGTFFFAGFVNWTINGRSLLPLAPAVGILIARRLDANLAGGWKISKWIPACLAASAVFALLVTRGDYLYAMACRQSAQQIVAQFGNQTDNVLFQGHWGYQYYMKAGGMKEFDVYHTALMPGNILANADYNTLVLPPETNAVAKSEFIYASGPKYLTTMNPPSGAGFYSSIFGPLPFAFGRVAPERVIVYYIKTNAPAKN
jgi:4-amino-4-deoxy-L-arabinose transferase-like glycosyltransferase